LATGNEKLITANVFKKVFNIFFSKHKTQNNIKYCFVFGDLKKNENAKPQKQYSLLFCGAWFL
jgi:hypothetical protein